jgi:hypothetical protein
VLSSLQVLGKNLLTGVMQRVLYFSSYLTENTLQKTVHLTLFRKAISDYSDDRKKYINAICEQSVQFYIVRSSGTYSNQHNFKGSV